MSESHSQLLPEYLPAGVDLEELVSPPQQDRSRRTLHSLVESAYHLLEDEGAEALTVSRVAQAAGTSVGSFYARFHGKEQLLRYMGELALGQALVAWKEVQGQHASPDLLPLAAHLVDAFRDGPLARLQLLDGIQDPAPSRLARFRRQSLDDIEGRMAGPQAWCGEDSPAPWVAARLLMAGARTLAKEDGSADPGINTAQELALALESYLKADGAALRSPIPGAHEVREPAPTPGPREEEREPEAQAEPPESPDPEEGGEPSEQDEEPPEEGDEPPVDPFDVWG